MEKDIEPIVIERKVIPIHKTILCPHCKVNLSREEIQLLSFPPRLIYSCPKCTYIYETNKLYPTIEWHVEENGTIGEQVYV